MVHSALIIGRRTMKKLAQPLLDGHSTHRTRDEMALTFDDPSLLRGAAADVLLKNRSEIFSSNVLLSLIHI